MGQRVADSVVEVVGNTPMVRLRNIGSPLKARLYAKLEYLNPGGSVKDRVAFQIVADAEEAGLLKPGGTIIEATSGNTGMGLALAAAVKGYKTIFVMPDKMSEEKIKSLRAFGSRVVVTPTAVEPDDPRSYYSVARRLVEETSNSFYANQYHNPSNPKAHYLGTGPELYRQLGGQLDAIFVAMGTGGTISGIGKYLKEQNPNIQVVGVDPVGSILYDYYHTGKMTEAHTYKVEGFGEDFVPSIYDFTVVDDVVRVTDGECFRMTRRLVREEGLYAGGSSGGAVAGALKWCETHDRDMNVVILLPDSATRYLSKIFDDDWMREHGFLEERLHHGTVADILAQKKRREVITARVDEPVREVVQRMSHYDVSQLPVLDADGAVLGIVTENGMLGALLGDQHTAQTPVGNLAEGTYSSVDSATRLNVLGPLFAQDPVALVFEDKRLVGILTKIDYIDFVSRAMT
jgi:cystathionine beta-synthase